METRTMKKFRAELAENIGYPCQLEFHQLNCYDLYQLGMLKRAFNYKGRLESLHKYINRGYLMNYND